MKLFAVLFSMLVSLTVFASERIFDCHANVINKSVQLPEEINLQSTPKVIFRDAKKNWSLQVGQLFLNTTDKRGPALKVEEALNTTNNTVEYSFWVDGSYEYELNISTVNHTAFLFWWGLGERTFVGEFNCDILEQ